MSSKYKSLEEKLNQLLQLKAMAHGARDLVAVFFFGAWFKRDRGQWVSGV